MNCVEWLELAQCPRDDDRAFERGENEDRQGGGARCGNTVVPEPLLNRFAPSEEGRRRTVDHGFLRVGVRGVTRFDGHRNNRATRTEVTALQLLTITVEEFIQRITRRFRSPELGRHVVTGVIDRFAEQLCAATREVVICRPPGGAAVLEDIGDGGGMSTPFPD